ISRQLQVWSYEQPSKTVVDRIPLVESSIGSSDVMSPGTKRATGLVAVGSSKNAIDFPPLPFPPSPVSDFCAYSAPSFFRYEATLAALTDFVDHGGELRILLCDPESQAVAARSSASIYDRASGRLHGDITGSAEAFRVLQEQMIARFGTKAASSCRMRMTR